MWGFLSGTLVLVALQTFVQPASADKLAAGSGALVSLLTRMLSANVPGIHRVKGKAGSGSGGTGTGDPLGDKLGELIRQSIAKQNQNMINEFVQGETPAKNLN